MHLNKYVKEPSFFTTTPATQHGLFQKLNAYTFNLITVGVAASIMVVLLSLFYTDQSIHIWLQQVKPDPQQSLEKKFT